MKSVMFLLLVSIFLSSGPYSSSKEQVIFDRIEYIYNLKRLIDKAAWKSFADKKYDLPLVYYTDSVCYIANPTNKFIASFKPNLVFEASNLKIYKTELLDSLPFHMETSLTFGDSSLAYNYKSPFMNCSSFEITQKTIHDVNATEQWATMVIHEYFHGFQFMHPAYLKYFQKNMTVIPEDSLRKVYKAQKWYKASIDKENEILLTALTVADGKQIKALIDSFFLLREQRRRQAKQQLNFDVTAIEQTYETMEGTARYVEYSLYRNFANKAPNPKLVKNDPAYQSYKYFRNHNQEKDKWLYLTDKTTYFYATGFNMVRLLEKLKIKYQKRLFREDALSLEQILKQYVAKKHYK
ncbi:hypothetical protein [Adhaeribacter rhizoryzae]|uniref:Uncharacterized protein n=1 Tax=Adhaeribacter rhizoryzae TaxID=2607907 RepID=A0A5M6DHE0_9BACT|nr:hypothetical protein [Adhaeribacter rhizoryzae]KAA5545806.1 hypothetical protein F0145_12820 [Adhaeribacter rhizoryzae]